MSGGGSTFDVQYQIRQNAQEVNDFTVSFGEWHKEMQSKDQQLLASKKAANAKKRNLSPDPVEAKSGSPSPPSAKPRKLNSPPPPNVLSPIKTDNKRLDVGDDQSSAATDEALARQQAVAEKDRGNAFFKNKKFVEAIACYSKGIQCDPLNAVLPANRAMALLKMADFKSAEDDCTLTISLDPAYVKAYQRRATAREQLGKYAEAIKDFQRVIELEPGNNQAKRDVERLEKKSSMKTKENGLDFVTSPTSNAAGVSLEDSIRTAFQSKSSVSEEAKPGQVFPICKKPHERSKEPLKRISISEVDSSLEMRSRKGAFDVEMREISSVVKKSSNEDAGAADVVPQMESIFISGDQTKKKRIHIEELSSSAANDDEGTGESNRNRTQHPVSRGSQLPAKKVERKQSAPSGNLRDKTEVEEMNTKGKTTLDVKSVTSSIKFYSHWKTLTSADEKFAFLNAKMATAVNYPSLFQSSMEAWVFEDIVDVVHRKLGSVEMETISRHLYGLSKVSRVRAIVMFVDDKTKLTHLIENVLQSGTLKDFEVESVRRMIR